MLSITLGGFLRDYVFITALAFIFGVLPLALSTGAGAGAREAVGVAVVGGIVGDRQSACSSSRRCSR